MKVKLIFCLIFIINKKIYNLQLITENASQEQKIIVRIGQTVRRITKEKIIVKAEVGIRKKKICWINIIYLIDVTSV